MHVYEQDSVELRLGHGYLKLTPVESQSWEQNGRVRFNASAPEGELQGDLSIRYLNAREFAVALRDVQAKALGRAELTGHPGFNLSVEVQPDGAGELQLGYAGRPEENFNLSFGLTFDQSYLPDFLAQLAVFNRSSAYKQS